MYKKYETDGYIICLGTGKEISEEEYNRIIKIINNRPQAPKGFTYCLTSALKWELKSISSAEELQDIMEQREELESEVEYE